MRNRWEKWLDSKNMTLLIVPINNCHSSFITASLKRGFTWTGSWTLTSNEECLSSFTLESDMRYTPSSSEYIAVTCSLVLGACETLISISGIACLIAFNCWPLKHFHLLLPHMTNQHCLVISHSHSHCCVTLLSMASTQ